MGENNLQPTFKRQRFLLSYICQLKNGATSTDLQKLIFLHTMQEKSNYYEFVPYRYGPYSFQLAADIETLFRDNFLAKSGSRIFTIGMHPHVPLFSVIPERGNNLLKKVYREYPYYTINSEIIDRLFNRKEADYLQSKRQLYSQTDQILFTIGYEGKCVEFFLNTLIQNDIKLICDVRKNPLSRKFGFSKNKLEYISSRVGIQYIHIPDLGIESEKRTSLNSEYEYHCLFDYYASTLPELKPFLEKVYALLCDHNRIALMCFEKMPEMCHRHVLRDFFIKTYKIRSIDL